MNTTSANSANSVNAGSSNFSTDNELWDLLNDSGLGISNNNVLA
jgi:hypothetical protein